MIKTEGLNLHTPRSTPQEDLYRQSAEVTTSVANGVVPSPNVCIEWLCREHLKITCLCTLNREHVKTFTSTLNRKHLKIDVLRIGIFSKLYVHLIENISKKKKSQSKMNILYAMNRKHFNVWFDNKSVSYDTLQKLLFFYHVKSRIISY